MADPNRGPPRAGSPIAARSSPVAPRAWAASSAARSRAEGAAIAIADIDVEGAKRAAAELEAGGHAALAVECNVADEQSVDNAVATVIDRFGGVDILVNNAGLHLTKYNQPFSVLPRADLREMLDVNVVGVVNCSVACRTSMQARGGGVIVSIASVSGHMSETPYGVSKLAVRGITVALAKEFAPDRIRVNAISPGLMASENAMADLPPELDRARRREHAVGPRAGHARRHRARAAVPLLRRRPDDHGRDAQGHRWRLPPEPLTRPDLT